MTTQKEGSLDDITALPGWLVLSLYGTSLGDGLMLDLAKVVMLRWLPVDRR